MLVYSFFLLDNFKPLFKKVLTDTKVGDLTANLISQLIEFIYGTRDVRFRISTERRNEILCDCKDIKIFWLPPVIRST